MDRQQNSQKNLSAPLPHREGQGESLQYIELYKQCRTMIHEHSIDAMNAVRDEAFEHFASAGFPSRKE